MAFDLDDEELEATRRLNGVAKEEIEKAILRDAKKNLLDKNDTESAKIIVEKCLLGNWVIVGGRINYIKLALRTLLAEREQKDKRIKELEEENKKNIERYEERDNEVWERVKQCKNMQTEIDGLYLDKEELEQAYLHEKLAKEEVEELLEDSIPKQKVKDKIKEIKEDKESKYFDTFLMARDINYAIEILEELLEDK